MIIEEKIDVLDYDEGTIAVIESFLNSSMNALEQCRSEVTTAFDRLEGQMQQYLKAIQNTKERIKVKGG